MLLFLKSKTGGMGPIFFLLNYLYGLFLGSVETYFLKVGAYVSLKRANTGLG